MRPRLFWPLAILLAAGCSSDGSTAVDTDADAIPQLELDAVRRTLNGALATDPLYPTLAVLVFPFVDRASSFVDLSGDTTRLVAIELDIQVDTSGQPVDAQLTTLLGWRGYRPQSRTVDSVFFVFGAGRAPVNDQLTESFSPDQAGSGTALVMHQAPDSTVTAWQTGVGELVTTSSSYGSPQTQSGGGLTVSVSRGTLSGHFAVTTAYEVPDSATTVATARDFSGGTRAMKIAIRGTLTLAPPRDREPMP